MNVDIIIASYGGSAWNDIGWSRAYPSAARALGGHRGEVIRVHERHASMSQVRNAGALQAEADWLCFLNPTDELEPGFFDEVEDAASGYGGTHWGDYELRSLLAPSVLPMDPFGRATDRPRLQHRLLPLDEVGNPCVGTVVRRDVFMEVGGFPPLPAYSDWSLWLACVSAGCALLDVPRAVYCRYEWEGSSLSFEERRQAWQAARAGS